MATHPLTTHGSFSPDTARVATLHGRALWPVRALWVLAALTALGIFLAAVPARLDQLSRPPEAARVELAALHLSAGSYAALTVAIDTLFVAVFAGVGWLIFLRRSDDRMALIVAFALVMWGPLNGLLVETPSALVAGDGSRWLRTLDWALGFAGYMSWMLFFYLFPSGRFVPGWTRAFAIAWLLFAGAWATLGDGHPLSPPNWPWPLFLAAVLPLWLSFPVAQVIRYRRTSDLVQRQQTKWVVFGVTVAVAGLIATILAIGMPIDQGPEEIRRRLLGLVISDLFVLIIPVSLGVAVLRHGLFEIDVLINRTVVYGSLTACVVAFYVVVVGAAGAVARAPGNLVVSLAVTGLVAVLFQPLRQRLQRGVNRLMYGERDEPYAVLSHLGRQLESTLAPEAVLPVIVRTVKDALKLPYVAVAIAADRSDAVQNAVAAGTPTGETLRLPLVYGSEPVGELLLAPRAPGEPFGAGDRRLLDDLARHAGVAVHALRLTADLRRSRERLVSAREEERRRLRRDLHDGLGPALASMTLQTEAARDLYAADPARGDALLADLTAQLQAATADIRRLVYDLRPPALDDLGLVGALRAQAARHESGHTRIAVLAPDALPPLPAAVEVAAYRIEQEALTNVLRHAGAAACTVTLAHDDRAGVLTVDIADDGRGLPEDARAGVGLSSMRERAEELGGACTIAPRPGGGTHVRAILPCLPPERLVQT